MHVHFICYCLLLCGSYLCWCPPRQNPGSEKPALVAEGQQSLGFCLEKVHTHFFCCLYPLLQDDLHHAWMCEMGVLIRAPRLILYSIFFSSHFENYILRWDDLRWCCEASAWKWSSVWTMYVFNNFSTPTHLIAMPWKPRLENCGIVLLSLIFFLNVCAATCSPGPYRYYDQGKRINPQKVIIRPFLQERECRWWRRPRYEGWNRIESDIRWEDDQKNQIWI